jgi:fructose-bisphosphate aldolase class II
MLEALIQTAKDIWPEAIFAVHLDHGDEDTCYDCIDSGFYSSVMIDASHEPFEGNVEITKRVVDRAHAKGVSVEANWVGSAAWRKTCKSMRAAPF